VLAGIGVVSQREDNPANARDPLSMMIDAARLAGADATPALLPRVKRILVPKGRWSYADPARAVAAAIDAKGAATVLSTVGVLQQTLIGQACAAIAEGEIDAALVVGADAGYRILRSRITGVEAPSPDPGGTPDVTLAPKEELRHAAEIRAGLRMPVGLYAIMESAFRARLGLTVAAHRDHLAALYGRFSTIAAANPAAWTQKQFPPEAIRTPSERNPMQAFPYTKLMCSSWNVDQASALLFCSVDLAERVGLARDRWIYPWSSTESNHMVPVCARPELAACPGAGIAGRAAIDPFGLSVTDLDLIELYSCFPVAVEAYASALGIDLARDLTVTGGMSFAGGPYNNYVLQATARMAELLRQGAGRMGLVGSVSGVLTKQGFGLWSRTPAPEGFRFTDCSDAVARVAPAAPVRLDYSGAGRIAGYTVVHDRGQAPRGIIVADVEGGRTVASADDPALVARMEEDEFCGAAVEIDRNAFAMAI
jgi:acetyl-CoA C-acetyltransferase